MLCRNSDNVVIKQILDHHVVSICEFDGARYHKLNPALSQIPMEREDWTSHNVKYHARMLPGEPVDDSQDGSTRRIFAASDSQFT
jgi:hypothetical protein